jgi:pimeloyl-ACP methyl ester carboxylesterase
LDDTIGWVGEQLGVNKPYKPFDINSVKKGDTVNVAFSGAWDGSQNGSQGLYNGVFNDLGEHAAMFRYNDVEAADKLIKELKAKGVNVNIYGHSWGSSPANTMAFKHNISKVTLVDPVKRGLKIHPDAKVYAPKDDGISNPNNFIAFVGGRQTDNNSIRVRGDHASMVNDAVADSFGTSVAKLRKKQQDQSFARIAQLGKKPGGSNPVNSVKDQRGGYKLPNLSIGTITK